MTIYEARRDSQGLVLATVIDEEGAVSPLRHLVLHSPDGFEYGYGGSGPSDLARSIIGHHLGTDDPAPVVYQTFKWEFVARWDQGLSVHQITSEEIEAWMAQPDTKSILDSL
jgi:hypothetical protein